MMHSWSCCLVAWTRIMEDMKKGQGAIEVNMVLGMIWVWYRTRVRQQSENGRVFIKTSTDLLHVWWFMNWSHDCLMSWKHVNSWGHQKWEILGVLPIWCLLPRKKTWKTDWWIFHWIFLKHLHFALVIFKQMPSKSPRCWPCLINVGSPYSNCWNIGWICSPWISLQILGLKWRDFRGSWNGTPYYGGWNLMQIDGKFEGFLQTILVLSLVSYDDNTAWWIQSWVFFAKRNTKNGVILVRRLGDRLNICLHGLHLDKLRMINLHNGRLE